MSGSKRNLVFCCLQEYVPGRSPQTVFRMKGRQNRNEFVTEWTLYHQPATIGVLLPSFGPCHPGDEAVLSPNTVQQVRHTSSPTTQQRLSYSAFLTLTLGDGEPPSAKHRSVSFGCCCLAVPPTAAAANKAPIRALCVTGCFRSVTKMVQHRSRHHNDSCAVG